MRVTSRNRFKKGEEQTPPLARPIYVGQNEPLEGQKGNVTRMARPTGNGNGRSATERRLERIAKRREKLSVKVETVAPDEQFEKAISVVGKASRAITKTVQAWNFGDIEMHQELVNRLSAENQDLNRALTAVANAFKLLTAK